MAGRWDAALAQSEQSLALMAELPNLNVRAMVHWSATLIPAARGDWAAAEAYLAAMGIREGVPA